MRIDFVITELHVGGAERCLTELALGLHAGGEQVRVFSLAPLPSGQQRMLVDRLHSEGIEVASGDADSVFHYAKAAHRLRQWLQASRPDVCQTFLYHANVLGTRAAMAAGVSIRVGGLRVAEYKPIRCRIERHAIKRMHSVVCVSEAVERFAWEHLQCSSEKTTVIANGVDVQRFSDAVAYDWSQLNWPKDAIVSLFLGRLHPQKGLSTLQQHVDTLARPGTRRRLLIVGDGPLRPELQAWADRIGPDRVQLMPWQHQVEPLLRGCRVLVLPSRYEGMPNVVLEAMAAGKPVVCSRVEGSDELLGHDLDRQTFPIDQPEALKNLVDPFLNDEALGDQLGTANRARIEARFSIPVMVDTYRQHYRSLCDRRLDDTGDWDSGNRFTGRGKRSM